MCVGGGLLVTVAAAAAAAAAHRGNGASVLRVVPYAAIHFTAYEHYRTFLLRLLHTPTPHTPQPLSGSSSPRGAEEWTLVRTGTPPPADTQTPGLSQQAQAGHGGETALAIACGLPPQLDEEEEEGGEEGGERDESGGGKRAGVPARGGSSSSSSSGSSSSTLASRGSSSGSSSSSTGSSSSSNALASSGSNSNSSRDSGTEQQRQLPPQAPPQPQHQHQHLAPVWDLVAGSLAGATAVILTYPLDLARTRLAWQLEPGSSPGARVAGGVVGGALQPPRRGQTIVGLLRETVASEGVRGLYRGGLPTLLGILPYAGLKFYIYAGLKHWYRERWHREQQQQQHDHGATGGGGGSSGGAGGGSSSGISTGGAKPPLPLLLVFGGISGVVGQTMTYPLDVLRRQMQVETSTQASNAAAAVAGKHPHASSSSSSSRSGSIDGSSSTRSSSIGGSSSSCSSGSSNSNESRSIGGSSSSSSSSLGSSSAPPRMVAVFRHILSEHGVPGFFRGLSLNFLKVVPSTALGFVVYDGMKVYLDLSRPA